jgi:modulator of FtsH protease HflC
MKKGWTLIGIVVVLGLILMNLTFFTVDQTERAIVVQLGRPVRLVDDPGLHFKLPLVQEVIFFEKRILTYDAAPAEVLTEDKKNLVVDNYVKWRIINPLRFYQTVRNVSGAQTRLDDIVYSEIRVQLGVHSLSEILSETRGKIMRNVSEKSDKVAEAYGIQVVDVRIKRADLPAQNEQAVFGRMNAERERQAKRYRSEGQEEAQKVRSTADKERAIILALAYRQAQEIKGKGDAQSIRTYAQAFQQNPEFYEFMRTLDAYKKALRTETTFVLTPDNQFLNYLEGVK